jgi:ethanolamine ammonia-lyase small subunit
MLAFQLAHARAQDAVHAGLDVNRLRAAIALPTVVVDSAAPDRQAYLQNPDLGRRLAECAPTLPKTDCDLALVIADGLSATAVQAHAPALIRWLSLRLSDFRLAPVVIARQARVAIGDPIGQALGAPIVVVLIGERPGLSAADGVSAYITFGPKPGRRDSERNCVSNIRASDGLTPERAVDTIVWLMREAQRLGFTGVQLKDRRIAPLNEAGELALSFADNGNDHQTNDGIS